MAIKKDTLDQLLSGRDPKEVFSKDGLFDELQKALAERVLHAESASNGPTRTRRFQRQLEPSATVRDFRAGRSIVFTDACGKDDRVEAAQRRGQGADLSHDTMTNRSIAPLASGAGDARNVRISGDRLETLSRPDFASPRRMSQSGRWSIMSPARRRRKQRRKGIAALWLGRILRGRVRLAGHGETPPPACSRGRKFREYADRDDFYVE